MRRPVAICVSTALAIVVSACGGGALPTTAPSFPALNASDFASGQAFSALPAGNMLATVDAGTLINQTIPTALEGSPDQKAKFEAELREFQERTGVDPKQLKLMAISARMPEGAGKAEVVAVMTGTFDVERLKAALSKNPQTGAAIPTETYGDTTLYINRTGDEEMAVAVLDPTTVVMGSPAAAVRQAIDARADKTPDATTNADLFNAFKETRETGIIRFATAVPAGIVPGSVPGQAAQPLDAAKYVFGSIDATAGIALDLTARTDSAEQAKPIYDQMTQYLELGKRQLAGNEQLKGFETMLEKTTVTQADRDVKMTMALDPITLLMVYDQFQRMSTGMETPPPSGATPGAMPATNANSNAAGNAP